MNPKDKKFQALQAKWYKKLKNKGFEDIERNEDHLKRYEHGHYLAGQNNGADVPQILTYRTALETYYRLVGWFLHDHKFESKIDKLVWSMHAEGASYREILQVLKAKGMTDNETHFVVYDIINRLKDEMKKRYANRG